MFPLKRVIGPLIFIWVGMMTLCLRAQEKPAYMYLGEEAKSGESQLESDTIYTGKVILYGELIPPPYIVEFKNDTAWINNIPFDPPIRIWTEPPHEVPESYRRESELKRRLYQDFLHLLESHDEAIACTLLVHRYLPDTLISRISFGKRGDYIPNVHVEFSTGHVSNITDRGRKGSDGKICFELFGVSQEEIVEGRRREADRLRTELRLADLKIISNGYYKLVTSNTEQEILLGALRQIARGEAAFEEIDQERPHLLPPRSVPFWREFDLRKETWK